MFLGVYIVDKVHDCFIINRIVHIIVRVWDTQPREPWRLSFEPCHDGCKTFRLMSGTDARIMALLGPDRRTCRCCVQERRHPGETSYICNRSVALAVHEAFKRSRWLWQAMGMSKEVATRSVPLITILCGKRVNFMTTKTVCDTVR